MRALVGIDLTDSSVEAVLQQAVGFAQKLGATLDIAFVDGLPYADHLIHDLAVRAVFERQAELLKKTHEDKLAALVAALPEAIRGVPVPRYGSNPERMLCELASGYDLLMVGTHGRTGLQHFLLGSVAERVIRNAKVPTLVLRGSTA